MYRAIIPSGPEYDYTHFCGVGYPDRSLNQDLKRIHKIWRQVRKTRDRDAIYDYLVAVYELVQSWNVERRAAYRAGRALKMSGLFVPEKIEPFAAIIAASISPKKIDRRQASKYARAMRLASACECRGRNLERFIKERGGLNCCAAQSTRRLGRR